MSIKEYEERIVMTIHIDGTKAPVSEHLQLLNECTTFRYMVCRMGNVCISSLLASGNDNEPTFLPLRSGDEIAQ